MQKKFNEVEAEFKRLKKRFELRKISDREFKDRLKKLRLNDQTGKCWTIGARTGKWYYFDGKNWIEAKPPTLQEGKAICIYCGYENELENETCNYCGGNLGGGDFSCPKCGCKLASLSLPCPECEEENIAPEIEPPAPAQNIIPSVSTWEKFTDLDSEIGEKEEALADDGGPNYILRTISPLSCLFFGGILGFIAGVILGIFTGASSFFLKTVAVLPGFLQSIHGKFFGGIVYGILGGCVGFIIIGVLGILSAVTANLLFSFIGGIKIRLEKI